jgi:hypothetical protein
MTQVPPAGPPVQEKPNTLAIVSLILGIASVVLCLMCVAGIPAIICGHLALKQIAQGQGGGAGMAKAGLIMGYIMTALGIVGIILAIVFPALLGTFAGRSGMSMD